MPSDAFKRELFQKADARLKRLFLQKDRYETKNYRPATGIGLFDIAYSRSARSVDVTVKVAFNFLNANPAEGHLAWTGEEKRAFKSKALRTCQDAWSYKYAFRCTKENWEEVSASVHIQMKETAPDRAHYIIDCRKVDKDHDNAWSGGCAHGATVWPYTANFSNWGVEIRRDFLGENVFNWYEGLLKDTLRQRRLECIPIANNAVDVPMQLQGQVDQYASYANNILKNNVKGINCYIYGSSAVGGGLFGTGLGKQRAKALATRLNRQVAFSNDFFVATTDSKYAAQVTQIQQRYNQVPQGGRKFEGVCLFVDVPKKSKRIVPTDYIVITHEFGHMLGCPDEYTAIFCTGIKQKMDLDQIVPDTIQRVSKLEKQIREGATPLGPEQHFLNEQVTTDNAGILRLHKQQKSFAYLIDQAEVDSPFYMANGTPVNNHWYEENKEAWYQERTRIKTQYGAESKQYRKFAATTWTEKGKAGATDSIMYTGQKILSAHYLPIWSALCSMTREFIDPTEWEIITDVNWREHHSIDL